MQYSNVPTKLPAIWGFNAKSPYINPIPVPSQQSVANGRASFADGFPPNCFIPTSAGGAGPFGGDFNGIFQQITAGLQFTQAGVIYPYDSNFQSTIGGYPNTAIVGSVTKPGWLWQSTVDNNMTNPDQGGAGWIPLGLSQFGIYGLGTAGQFTQGGNYTLTAANCGQIGFFNGTTAATWTLPAANSFPAYTTKIVIRNIGSAPLTLAAASGNTLDMSVPTIQPGQTAAVVLDGNTTWRELWNDAGNIAPFSASNVLNNQIVLSSSTTLTASQAGNYVFWTGSTAGTITLPNSQSFTTVGGGIFYIQNIGTANVSIATVSTDHNNLPGGNNTLGGSAVLIPGQSVIAIVNPGAPGWQSVNLNLVPSLQSVGSIVGENLSVNSGLIVNPGNNSGIILGNGTVGIINAGNTAYIPLTASTLNLVSGLLTNTNLNSGIVLGNNAVGAINAGNTAYVPFSAANGTSGNQVVNFSQFSNNGSTVVSIPNLTLQFSNYTLTGPGSATVNLPVAFPNACLQVICSYDSGYPTPTSGTCGGAPISGNKSQIQLYNSASSSNEIRYLAIGY